MKWLSVVGERVSAIDYKHFFCMDRVRALCNTRHKNNNNSHKSLYIQLDIVSYIVEMIFCNDRTRKIYLKIISLLLSVDRKTTAP
jgi:hypothetical protein